MAFKARHKRFVLIGIGLALVGLAAMLILNAFQSNMVFFYTPNQVGKSEGAKRYKVSYWWFGRGR